jgi:hypothetical protein
VIVLEYLSNTCRIDIMAVYEWDSTSMAVLNSDGNPSSCCTATMTPSQIFVVSISAIIVLVRIPLLLTLVRLMFHVKSTSKLCRLHLFSSVLVHTLPVIPCAISMILAAARHIEYSLMSHAMTLGLLLFSDWVSDYRCILTLPAYHNRSSS